VQIYEETQKSTGFTSIPFRVRNRNHLKVAN
jgi:hypothetical protein